MFPIKQLVRFLEACDRLRSERAATSGSEAGATGERAFFFGFCFWMFFGLPFCVLDVFSVVW